MLLVFFYKQVFRLLNVFLIESENPFALVYFIVNLQLWWIQSPNWMNWLSIHWMDGSNTLVNEPIIHGIDSSMLWIGDGWESEVQCDEPSSKQKSSFHFTFILFVLLFPFTLCSVQLLIEHLQMDQLILSLLKLYLNVWANNSKI